MRTLIIDDQPLVREKTRFLLESYAPQVEILGEAEGVKSGLETIPIWFF